MFPLSILFILHFKIRNSIFFSKIIFIDFFLHAINFILFFKKLFTKLISYLTEIFNGIERKT